jgi:multicomponent Na+:H+ antiporter subunit E
MKSVSLFIMSCLLWLLLSGHFEVLMLALGLASVILTVFLSLRMNIVDHESYPINLTFKVLRFLIFLWREIILANIDVVVRILKPGKSISPRLANVPLPQKTDLGRVIYANAITLTPGTVSVQLDKENIAVHALAQETIDDLQTGRMANMVPEDPKDASK